MEKKYIQQFLKERKRGVYTLIVQTYPEVFESMGVNMALQVIKDDLEKQSGVPVELNYFSLAQAVVRYKKKLAANPGLAKRKNIFMDSHEEGKNQLAPGKFTLR